MATGIDKNEAKRLLDASMGVVAMIAPTTPMKIALNTATSSDDAAGTEVVNAGGSAYARQDVVVPAGTADSTGAVTNNSSAIVAFTNMPAATVTNANEYDSAGTPRRTFWGDLASAKTTALGDTLSFAIGALTFRIG